jgi:hypothetical protein
VGPSGIYAIWPQWAHIGFPELIGELSPGFYRQLRSISATWALNTGISEDTANVVEYSFFDIHVQCDGAGSPNGQYREEGT